MQPFRKSTILIVALAAAVAACGGPGTGTGNGGPGSTAAATPAPQTDGESVDAATIQASVDKLATLTGFTYEMTIGTRSIGKDHTLKLTGVEHPVSGDRALYGLTNEGVDWSSVSVGGEYFGDIGRGLEPLEAREDATQASDPNWVGNLMRDGLSPRYDDFVLVGDESFDGRGVRHYVLDEYALSRITNLVDDQAGFETFTVELWIDSADGYLAKAHVGRLPFPSNGFSGLTEWHFEIGDVGCDCPITRPTVAGTPVPETPQPTATAPVAPEALTCGGEEVASSDLEWAPDPANPQEPVDIVRAWPGVSTTDEFAFGGLSIFVFREGSPIAEFQFDGFGQPTHVNACAWGEIGTAG